ncbi:MAG: hypothetical protein AAF203_03805 [Pseudomonadota bacterium]
MPAYLVSLLPILVLCFLGSRLSRITKIPAALGPFLAVNTVNLILYIGFYFHAPHGAAYFLCGFAVLSFLLSPKQTIQDLITPPLLAFLGFSVVNVLYFQNYLFHSWDEFSHWGRISHELFRLGKFAAEDSFIMFLDYPPGTAVFHSFFYQWTGYDEGIAYIAQNTWILSLLPILCYSPPKVSRLFLPLNLAIFYILPFAATHSFFYLIVELPLAVSFAGSVLVYFYLQKHPYRLAMAALTLPNLFLIKKSGMLFLVITLCMILWNEFNILRKEQNSFQGFGKRLVTVASLVLLPSLLVIASWEVHLKTENISPTYQAFEGGQQDSLFTEIFINKAPLHRQTIKNFSKAMVMGPLGYNSNFQKWPKYFQGPLAWFLLGLLAFVALLRHRSRASSLSTVILGVLLIGGLVYFLGLLKLCLTAWGVPKPGLVDFPRYAGVYILGFSWILLKILQTNIKVRLIPWILVLFIGLTLTVAHTDYYLIFHAKEVSFRGPSKVHYRTLYRKIRSFLIENDMMEDTLVLYDNYYIWFMMASWDFRESCIHPISVPHSLGNLPRRRGLSEIICFRKNPGPWQEKLNDYKYLLILFPPPRYKAKVEKELGLTLDSESYLYHIGQKTDGKWDLTPVENAVPFTAK